MVGYREMTKLKYVRNVIHETLRRHTIAARSRFSPDRDIEMPNGEIIEKGTYILCPNSTLPR